MDGWERAQAVLRALGAAVVIYAFAVVLMTATAQQAVTGALEALPGSLGYSSAFARMEDLQERRREIDRLSTQVHALTREHGEAEYRLRERAAASETAWAELGAAVRTVEAGGRCPARTGEEPLASWHWAVQCLRETSLTDREAGLLREAVERSPSAFDLHQRQFDQSRLADRLYNQLQAARNELQTARTAVREGEALEAAFDETDILREGRLPGAGLFVPFPPALVQLLLAFASGLFGALLITLVLSVYPKSSLKFATGEGIGARILLGGLIAVGVFIVLSGGASVLGGSGGVAEPDNVMAFTAIGILAGMFSDRVAFWLSEKAEVFFARGGGGPDGGGRRKTDGPTPAAPGAAAGIPASPDPAQ